MSRYSATPGVPPPHSCWTSIARSPAETLPRAPRCVLRPHPSVEEEGEMKAFLAGLGLGAAAGILIAPQRGAATRRAIGGSAQQAAASALAAAQRQEGEVL